MMSLWDALRMNMMISYQELVRTFPSFSVKILLLIWGSIISSAMAAGMLTDTSISSLLLPGINAFTRCRSLTSIALSGSRIVTANQTDS